MDNSRQIGKQSQLQKMFQKTVRAGRRRRKRPSKVLTVAFKEGSTVDDVVGLIRQVLITGREFAGEHVHISNNDVKTAYDVMKHADIMHAMKNSGLTNKEAWVVARELAGSQLLLEVPATDRSVKIAMEKGGCKGVS